MSHCPLLCIRADVLQQPYANISMDKGKPATSKTGTIQKSVISLPPPACSAYRVKRLRCGCGYLFFRKCCGHAS